MYHIKLEAIILSALVLIIMLFTCHFKAYLNEGFTTTLTTPIDPNKLYTRLPGGEVLNNSESNNTSSRFSRMYRMQMGGTNYDSKFCKNTKLADPCPEVLNKHSEIPADIVAQCKSQFDALNATPSPSAAGSSLQNFTDDEIQEMVRRYAHLTSQRNPQAPWDFNPYGSPAINL
jgi:hypothetical protein